MKYIPRGILAFIFARAKQHNGKPMIDLNLVKWAKRVQFLIYIVLGVPNSCN